jgi:hypothetical protein
MEPRDINLESDGGFGAGYDLIDTLFFCFFFHIPLGSFLAPPFLSSYVSHTIQHFVFLFNVAVVYLSVLGFNSRPCPALLNFFVRWNPGHLIGNGLCPAAVCAQHGVQS